MEEYIARFDLEYTEADGDTTRLVKEIHLADEDSLCLPDVLRVLRDFLHTIGFNYVDELVSFCGDREIEHSSEDWASLDD